MYMLIDMYIHTMILVIYYYQLNETEDKTLSTILLWMICMSKIRLCPFLKSYLHRGKNIVSKMWA